MRKTIVLGLAAAVAVAAAGSPAGAAKRPKPKKRAIELTYTEPAYGTAGLGVCFQGASCLFYGPPAPGETRFSVVIEDDLGQPVPASVIQDTNEDGSYLVSDDLTVDICGATDEPIEMEPGKAVSVWVWRAGANPPCPGTATSGTATGTFSR